MNRDDHARHSPPSAPLLQPAVQRQRARRDNQQPEAGRQHPPFYNMRLAIETGDRLPLVRRDTRGDQACRPAAGSDMISLAAL